MTTQDRPAFAELMVAIGETYGEPVSAPRMELYYRALADLPIEAIRAAADAHVKHQKFFPRPAELREAVEGSVEDRAELAWVHVLREVRRVGYYGSPAFPDEATRRAALEMFGGWRALCENLPASGPELLGHAKQFKASFGAYARREHVQPALPPGRDEARGALTELRDALVKRGLPAPGLTR